MSRLSKQAKKVAASQALLERLVLEAHTEGKSLRDIATATGKTPEGIRKMIARVSKATPE